MKTIKDKKYSLDHVNQRLNERFGQLPMNEKTFNELNEYFQNNKKHRLVIESNGQEVHQISFKGHVVSFVFCSIRGYITTALDWS